MSLKNNNNNNILSHTDIKSSTNVRLCVSKHDSGDVNISDIISNNHSKAYFLFPKEVSPQGS